MALNASKSVCIRYGPRFDSDCSEISTNDGDCLIRSVSTCRYLSWPFSGRIEKVQNFSGQWQKSFYLSLNAIFGKIGRLASEEVILHLISVKCLPVLMYGLDACPVCMSDKRSLDFIVTSREHLWKCFRLARSTSSKSVKLCLTSVEWCQSGFLKGNVDFFKNFARVRMAYVKLLPLWRRVSCHRCVPRLVKAY